MMHANTMPSLPPGMRNGGPARHRAAVPWGLKRGLGRGCRSPSYTSDDAHGVARIKDIPGSTIRARLDEGEVAVITGFQAWEPSRNRVSTLGRGGSDTSAVAVAIALNADLCDIYTDVDGVYTTDPRIVRRPRACPRSPTKEMLEMASLGSKSHADPSVESRDGAQDAHTSVLSSFVAPRCHAGGQPRQLGSAGTIICSEMNRGAARRQRDRLRQG